MLSEDELREVINDELLPDAQSQWGRLDNWAKRRSGQRVKTWTPDGVDAEYQDFIRKSRTPWLAFASRVIAQAIHVDGYSTAQTWEKAWLAAGMEGRQATLNRDVIDNGYSYLLTFPDEFGNPFMRHLRANATFSIKEDPWDDDPSLVLTKVKERNPKGRGQDFSRLFDAEAMYEIYGPLNRPDRIDLVPHELGRNPVSIIETGFYADGSDDPESPVAIGLAAYHRLVDATFMLLMVGRYGAFPQKYMAGGALATDEEGNVLVRPSVDSILHTKDYDAKFGTFQSADIEKAVAAVDEQFEELTAILQVPPYYLHGKVVNVNADALAASEAGFQRLTKTIQRSMKRGYGEAMRNAEVLLGIPEDPTAELSFEDVTTRSLSAVADAVQKLNSAGADPEATFQMVPVWSKQMAKRAAEGAADRIAARKEPDPAAGQPSELSAPVPDGTGVEQDS